MGGGRAGSTWPSDRACLMCYNHGAARSAIVPIAHEVRKLGQLRHNRQPLRVHTAIIAALYVLLCIGGPLTHTHHARGWEEPAWSASASGADALHSVLAARHRVSPADNCPYCEWLANGVSLAPARFDVAHTPLGSFAYVPFACTRRCKFLVRVSSRGPPTI
jgi:hypothetical protein